MHGNSIFQLLPEIGAVTVPRHHPLEISGTFSGGIQKNLHGIVPPDIGIVKGKFLYKTVRHFGFLTLIRNIEVPVVAQNPDFGTDFGQCSVQPAQIQDRSLFPSLFVKFAVQRYSLIRHLFH